jgi:hypothetical protein
VTPDPTALAALGFTTPRRAHKELSALEARLGAGPARVLLEKASASADPDAHLAAFDRVKDALASCHDARTLDWLSRLFEASELVPRILAGRPGLARWLMGSRTLDRARCAARGAGAPGLRAPAVRRALTPARSPGRRTPRSRFYARRVHGVYARASVQRILKRAGAKQSRGHPDPRTRPHPRRR